MVASASGRNSSLRGRRSLARRGPTRRKPQLLCGGIGRHGPDRSPARLRGNCAFGAPASDSAGCGLDRWPDPLQSLRSRLHAGDLLDVSPRACRGNASLVILSEAKDLLSSQDWRAPPGDSRGLLLDPRRHSGLPCDPPLQLHRGDYGTVFVSKTIERDLVVGIFLQIRLQGLFDEVGLGTIRLFGEPVEGPGAPITEAHGKGLDIVCLTSNTERSASPGSRSRARLSVR